jgi:hypothetical protein
MRARDVAGFFLALLVVLVTWAVAVPRFGAPDETAHVYKAYGTAHGELLGIPAPGFPDNLREFDGPDSLGPPDLPCYIGQPDVPAACATTETSPRLISSAARYPPYYYGLVGVPVAVAGQSESVLAYRLVSAALCVALLTLAMCVAKRSRRSDLAALVPVALTPMVLFVMASVNPNAAELAGFFVIWCCLARVASDDALPERLLRVASFTAAAVVLTRPISIVWLAGTVVVALVATSPARRRQLLSWRLAAWAIVPTGVASVGSWLWLQYARFEVVDERVDRSRTFIAAMRESMAAWTELMRETVGVLGWLDTRMPSFVYVAWAVALVIVAVIHVRSATRRALVALAVLAGVWLALPLVINAFTYSRAGLTFQGRYALPVFVGVAFLPMWSDGSIMRWPRLQQRWLIGADGKIILAGTLPWSPAVAPMLLIAANLAAMAAVAWSAWRPWGQVEAAAGERHGERPQHGPH